LGAGYQLLARALGVRGYAEDTINVYLRCIGRLAEMMKANGIAIADLDEAQAVELVARTSWNPKRTIAATFIVRCFVRFLAERGVGTPALPPTAKEIAWAELKRDYETYLRRQRGLSERTIFHSWRIADRFLEFRFEKEFGDLSRITTTDIVGFL
jgi:integrase/recombinase XerD